jgi:hypothetical protein
LSAVKVWPSRAVPEIVGGAVFEGGAAETTAVCADGCVLEPATFEAVTCTLTAEPTSAAVSVKVCAAAPVTSLQLPAAQRCHWYPYAIGGVPVHSPFAAVNVCPACAVPEIVGGAVLAGAAATTTSVSADVAVLDPAEFDAVTSTRTDAPTSTEVSVYVCAVAPAMFVQLPPEQRCHW